MEQKEQFSAFVVIPASVFFNHKISDRGKLLYGLISCMSNAKGYCFAKNETLARYLGADDRTVRRLLKELADAGAIRVENGKGGRNTTREIWIADTSNPDKNVHVNPDKNVHVNPDKNVHANPDKNVHQNNININNTPYNPPGDAQTQNATQMRFDEFWSAYPEKRDKKKAQRSFERLKVDDNLLKTMISAIDIQKQTDQWQRGIIPLPTTWLNGRRWEDEVSIPGKGAEPQTAKEDWLY